MLSNINVEHLLRLYIIKPINVVRAKKGPLTIEIILSAKTAEVTSISAHI